MIVALFTLIKLTEGLYIKSTLEDKYMTLNAERLTYVKLSPNISDAVDVIITKYKDGIVYIKNSKDSTKTFDIAELDKLNMYLYHGGTNQQFMITMVDTNKYNILSMNKCLTYDSVTGYIHLRACSNSDSQIFEIVDENKLLKTLTKIGLNDVYITKDGSHSDIHSSSSHRKRHHNHHHNHHH